MNVVSNFGFLLVSYMGLAILLSGAAEFSYAYTILFISLLGVSIGSAYYHANPNDSTLIWDRLPMTIAFMAVLSIMIKEKVDEKWGTVMLIPSCLIGILSILIWIITDGRDVAPDCAKTYINQIIEICDEDIKIGTIAGRYYTMDRDNRWDRVKKGYDAIAFANPLTSNNVLEYIDDSYKNEIFDEFIVPTAFNDYDGLKENDGVIFCNFRSDRMREISSVFANKNFNEFDTIKNSLNIATMTQYDKNTPLPILFPKDSPKNTLAEVISNAGLSQLHTAETEKYAHVTFFFNGGVEEPVLNETRVLIPSPSVATYDLQPEMSAPQVAVAVKDAMKSGTDFIVVNFANGDMVGHTGVFEAAIKAVEAVDYELGLILDIAKELNYNVILTSDHGNCEMMKDEDGNTLTNHTVGDVYCFVISQNVKEVKIGSLNNIAPTVLKLMNLEIPNEMDEPLI
jgi:2,3-bisphosphoglycerate-independent phosphoglycerate mutase